MYIASGRFAKIIGEFCQPSSPTPHAMSLFTDVTLIHSHFCCAGSQKKNGSNISHCQLWNRMILRYGVCIEIRASAEALPTKLDCLISSFRVGAVDLAAVDAV